MRNGSRLRALFAKGICALASAALLLGIAGCEPEGATGASISVSGTERSPEPMRSSAKETGASDPAVADAIEASLPIDMPPAEDIEITPIESANDPEGNARISVRFGGEEALPDTFAIEIDQRSSTFKRSEKDPRRFEGSVWFDFDAFAAEQKARAADLAQRKEPVAPRFDGRNMIGEERLDVLDPALVSLARQNGSAFRVPRGTVSVPAERLDPARMLTITDLGVVNDRLRTYDICSEDNQLRAIGDPNGAWTFKTLITRMANTPRTGVTPEQFVEQWLASWDLSPEVNGHIVPARMQMKRLVLDPWRSGPGGPVDLDKAPFRLLAIVNRLDLRGNPIYGGGNGGELRFVFGVVNRNDNRGCSTMPFTVILEYGVPLRGCSAAKDYAADWIALGNAQPGTPEYNEALQTITDRVTAANAAPAKPNGSAINQIRTNEIALGIPWQLRQFEIPPGESLLKLVSTAQTPHEDYDQTPLLARFMDERRAQILGDRHVVPASYSPRLFEVEPLLAGATFTHAVSDDRVWKAPAGWPVDPEVRHKFSLATCNGCHGGEARDNFAETSEIEAVDRTEFVHIDVRMPGRISKLSKFLIGEGTLSAPSTFLKPDPAGLGGPHRLGDLLRRRQDLADFVSGSCHASGLVEAFYAGQLRFTH